MTPLILVVAGLLICFGAFVYAAINMYRGVTNTDQFQGFGSMFKGHIGAMIAMAFGGLLFAIGLIWGVLQLLS